MASHALISPRGFCLPSGTVVPVEGSLGGAVSEARSDVVLLPLGDLREQLIHTLGRTLRGKGLPPGRLTLGQPPPLPLVGVALRRAD